MHFADRLGIDAANIFSYGLQLKEPQIQNVKKSFNRWNENASNVVVTGDCKIRFPSLFTKFLFLDFRLLITSNAIFAGNGICKVCFV